ncbi:MAG: DUF5317 family protein [Actinomycetota bacterium]|nr:DUF5317 family protein [Actinomycetota bacterium]
MRFTLVAVAAGLAIGVLSGGRPAHMAGRSFRHWPVLAAAIGLQALSGGLAGGAGLGALVASYALLVAFAAANVVRVGMGMVALGIGLNLLTIAVNGGMPVGPSAVVAAGIAEPDQLGDLRIEGKRHLQRPSDRLMALSDVIPVRPLREVVSFGDVVMAVGLADVLVHLLRPPRGGAHVAMGTERQPAHARRGA